MNRAAGLTTADEPSAPIGGNPPPEVLSAVAYRVFVIEALLTVTREEWSEVVHGAFTDARQPGPRANFNSLGHNCDVTQTRSRVTRRTHPSLATRFGDVFAFTDRRDALACAERLRKFGRWRSAWEGGQPWDLRAREEEPRLRVVEIHHAETRTLVADLSSVEAELSRETEAILDEGLPSLNALRAELRGFGR